MYKIIRLVRSKGSIVPEVWQFIQDETTDSDWFSYDTNEVAIKLKEVIALYPSASIQVISVGTVDITINFNGGGSEIAVKAVVGTGRVGQCRIG